MFRRKKPIEQRSLTNKTTRTALTRICSVILMCLVVIATGSYFLIAHTTQTKAATTGTPPLGLNVDFNEQSQVDLIKNDARFEQVNGITLTEDANGWPTSDFSWVLDNRYTFAWNPSATNADPLKFATNLSGTYKLSFTGQATLTAAGDDPAHEATTIANQAYNSSTNVTTADVTFGNPSGGLLSVIQFTSTKRTAGSAAGSGVTNVQLIRPGYQPGTTQVLTSQWLNAITNYKWSALRFMDSLGTNNYASPGSGEAYPYLLQWSTDRLQPDKGPLYGSNHVGVHGTIPWEYVVLVAQLTHKDLWINIPVNASSDYVNNVAGLLKNGNAFTGNQGVPADVNIYVEYSNEMWHYGFPQGPWNLQAAKDEVAAGGTNLNYDGKTDDDTIRFRRIAKRTIEIGNQFKSVFSDNGTRIRPVINNANVDADVDMLQYVNDNYGTPNKVLYGISQTGYYTSADSSSVSAILSGEKAASDQNATGYLKSRTIATYFGLHSLVYEGGQDEEGDTNIANKFAAARDSGMADVVTHDLLGNWYPSGGELYMEFSEVTHYSTYGMWGATEDLSNLTTGKWNGLVQTTNATQPAVTAGLKTSTTVGQTVSVPETSGGTDYITPSSSPWKELLLNVPQAGTYAINAFGHREDSSGILNVKLDNTTAGSLSLPLYPAADGSASQAVVVTLTSGLHSIFIYVQGSGRQVFPSNGTITVTTQSISASTPTPTPTPTQGGGGGGTNLAQGKTATASSSENSGTGPAYAVDGSTSTRWSSQYSDPQWLQVDLGNTVSVNEVKLFWETAYGKAYQIQVSNDATNWSTIYTQSNGSGGNEDLTGLSGSGRYIRMYGTQRGTGWGYSLWEFQVFGSVVNGTPSNLSQGKTATASSSENSGTGPGYAVDGSTSTRWSSQYSDPQWLQVDLGATHQISEVKLFWETAYGKAYQIQVSNDGTNWTTIYTQSNGSGGNEDLTGLSGSGRYVRMYGTQRGTGWGYSLWEFQVFGY